MGTLFVDIDVELKVKMKSTYLILSLSEALEIVPEDIMKKGNEEIERYITSHIEDVREFNREIDKIYEDFECNLVIDKDVIEEISVEKMELGPSVQ